MGESGDFHRHLLGSLSTAVLVLGEDLRVLYISPAAQALLELSESRIVGAHFGDAPAGHQLLPRLLAARAGGLDAPPYTCRGVELHLPGGQELAVDCTVSPVVGADTNGTDANPWQILLELHPVDRILRISREAGAISAQENTQALLRGLAHEIKNPLGGLRGAAQLLARELPGPELKEYTRIIIEEADRLRDLVDHLLGTHRRPHFGPLNVHEVTEHVRALAQAELGGAGRIERDYDPSVPDLRGDRAQLIQAVLNIVRNGIQATAQNSGGGEITLRTRVQRTFTIGGLFHKLVCRVDIIDNGPGIPPELEDAIFMPMVSGRPGGSGLGLAIAQSIINSHKGLIECRSSPGRTRFTLFLPMALAEAEARP